MRFNSAILLLVVPLAASFIPRNGPCIPGELVWVDCNLCTCNQRGMPNYICATMWCQPQGNINKPTTEIPFDEDEEEREEDNTVMNDAEVK